MNCTKDYFIGNFYKNFGHLKNESIVLYGVGQFTKWIIEEVKEFHIVGLMDLKTIGQTIYGFKVLSEREVAESAKVIIIVSNLSVSETIYHRIKTFTEEAGIIVFYLNGLQPQKYNESIANETYWNKNEEELKTKILQNDVISFDIFDTLLMRKCLMPEDIFYFVEMELGEEKTGLNFPLKRKNVERTCYQNITKYFNFQQLYEVLYNNDNISEENREIVMQKEKEIEWRFLLPRSVICKLFWYAKEHGKTVILTSDMYLDKSILDEMLYFNGIYDYDNLLLSCEIGRDKYWGSMWEYVTDLYQDKKILHIGDNKIADEKTAREHGIHTYLIASSKRMLELSGIQSYLGQGKTVIDRLLIGLFISKSLNNPFCLSSTKGKLYVSNMYEFGYLFFGPLILAYLLWLIRKSNEQQVDTILFVARDGYLLEKLYQKLVCKKNLQAPKGVYFLSSRRVASVAAIEAEEDIWFIFDKLCSTMSVKYEQLLDKAFGISIDNKDNYYGKLLYEIGKEKLFRHTVEHYGTKILKNAAEERKNYLTYIDKLSLGLNVGFVNFVCRGVTQYCISKIIKQRMKGFYFAAEEDLLDIYPWKEDIFCLYEGLVSTHTSKWNLIIKYLFGEVVLTAPEGQLIYFEKDEIPVYEKRKSSFEEIKKCHQGIEQYVEDIMNIIPNIALGTFSLEMIDKIFGVFGLENVILSEEVINAFQFEDFYGI